MRRQSTIKLSKVAGTAGGQDALKILMGHMPEDDVE
jgi:hypothetical protein